jgi:spore coat polysaccharide biosynthesis protein SpsF
LRAFIQARMSSRRFPGKVLAPFRGVPVLEHVVNAVRRALPEVPLVVLTSSDPSDDAIAGHLGARGLDDVLGRFVLALAVHPCEWILRVNADSPLLAPEVLRAVAERSRTGADLVTTTFPRSFPVGQNAELISAEALRRIDAEQLGQADREHVTAYFYRHPDGFVIVPVSSSDPTLADLRLAIDEPADLERLERVSTGELERIRGRFFPAAGGGASPAGASCRG